MTNSQIFPKLAYLFMVYFNEKSLLFLFSSSGMPNFANQWAAAQQASLSFTISWNFLKFVSIESVMPSNHLVLYCPLLLLQFSWVPLPYCSPPRCPFPIKSLALSAHVSPRTIHFRALDKSPVLGPGRGLPSCNKWRLWRGLFFAETDILTTLGTQGPACLPMDQTQRPQLGPFCPWSPLDADNWPECPDQ